MEVQLLSFEFWFYAIFAILVMVIIAGVVRYFMNSGDKTLRTHKKLAKKFRKRADENSSKTIAALDASFELQRDIREQQTSRRAADQLEKMMEVRRDQELEDSGVADQPEAP